MQRMLSIASRRTYWIIANNDLLTFSLDVWEVIKALIASFIMKKRCKYFDPYLIRFEFLLKCPRIGPFFTLIVYRKPCSHFWWFGHRYWLRMYWGTVLADHKLSSFEKIHLFGGKRSGDLGVQHKNQSSSNRTESVGSSSLKKSTGSLVGNDLLETVKCSRVNPIGLGLLRLHL